MFAFLPQVLIIISIAGIIVLVLRKLPAVTAFVKGLKLEILSRKLWQYVLEVKELSKNPHFPKFPASFPKIHLPTAKFPFLKRPDTPAFYLKEAQVNFEKGDFDEAERKFIKAIEKDSRNEEAYAGLGKIYLAQKNYEEAIEVYKYLVKHFPANDLYHANLAQAYHGNKLYEQAIEAYEQAIALSPDNAKRYVNLGLSLEAKNHTEEAILNYRKAADLERTNTQFLMVLAEALIKKDDKEEAEHILEQILQIEPTNHVARERLMGLKF
ncbi:MAG: tetratricopeptide repeat protein [Candidatus Doudnabacteria bacterium]|nr:tetratricopeptide repeat protein [Candidatus Doudnabacteria bacterium]